MTLPSFIETAIATDNPDTFQGFYAFGYSPNGRYVLTNIAGSTQSIWTLDRTDESCITAFDDTPAESVTYNGAAIDDDGTVYVTPYGTPVALYSWSNFARGTKTLLNSDSAQVPVAGSLSLFVMPDDSRKLVWLDGIDDTDIQIYDVDTDTLSTVSGLTAAPYQQLLQDSYGDVWAVGGDGDNIYFHRVIDNGAGSGSPDFNTIADTQIALIYLEAYHTSAGWFVSRGGGKDLYLLDGSDFSVLQHRSYAATGGTLNSTLNASAPFLKGLAAGEDTFWFPGPDSFADGAYSDICEINAADLTTLQTLDAHTDWALDDTPDTTPGMVYSTNTRPAIVSQSLSVPSDTPPSIADYTPVIRYFGTIGDGGGAGGAADEGQAVRCWGYTLDGHDFYVMRLGTSETLVYDLSTQQWSSWSSPSRNNWRAHIGQNWQGMTSSLATYPTDVVAGDDTLGLLWVLDPTKGVDDNTDTGQTAFRCRVTGGVPFSGRDNGRCNAVTLTLSLGQPSLTGASITLSTSDDFGHSWTDHGAVTVAAGTYDATVEWRGLGLMKAPGRVFQFADSGAVIRLSRADIR